MIYVPRKWSSGVFMAFLSCRRLVFFTGKTVNSYSVTGRLAVSLYISGFRKSYQQGCTSEVRKTTARQGSQGRDAFQGEQGSLTVRMLSGYCKITESR